MNGRESLLQAAKMVLEASKDLNLKQSKCGCCGLVGYEDFSQAKAFKELEAAAAKLQKIANGAAFSPSPDAPAFCKNCGLRIYFQPKDSVWYHFNTQALNCVLNFPKVAEPKLSGGIR